MSVAGGLVLFAVIWAMCLFVALPLKIRSQEESGKVVRGTPPSAPTHPMLKQKVVWVTVAAIAVWIPIAAIISYEIISITDLDFFGRWGDGQYG